MYLYSLYRDVSFRRLITALLVIATSGIPLGSLHSQEVDYRVEQPSQRLEMVVNTSRILSIDKEVPRVLVNNKEIVSVVPISPNEVQISAVKPGVTQVNLWDEDGAVRSVDIIVYPDGRRLEMVLRTEFPKAAIRVRPLENSVILAGYVDRPEVIDQIVTIAQDFYPKVINNIAVGGVQQVALHVKVMEVSRTKIRSLGFDWALFTGNDSVISSAAGLISAVSTGGANLATTGLETLQFGIVDGNTSFFGVLEALRSYGVVKVLAEPTLVTVSGRPASFQEGGEFPVVIPQSLGTNAIEFKEFGTRVDFVPLVQGNGNIRLEVRPQVSEIDNARGVDLNGIVVPGLRTRWVDTAVEMRSGQTLALAGLIQTRVENENRGLPWIADLPWVGNLFGRQREEVNEVELLVVVRPELVAAMDPHQVPPVGPGESNASPCDVDFYGRRYVEVPRCCPEPRCTPPGGLSQGVNGPGLGMNQASNYGPANAQIITDQSTVVSPNAGYQPMPNDGSGTRMSPSYTTGSPQTPRAMTNPNPIPNTMPVNTSPSRGSEYGQSAGGDSNGLFGPSGYDEVNF